MRGGDFTQGLGELGMPGLGWTLGVEELTRSQSQKRARSMGYSLQKEAEAMQRGAKQKSMPLGEVRD